jgi:mono/diheme cytochrome c family protein
LEQADRNLLDTCDYSHFANAAVGCPFVLYQRHCQECHGPLGQGVAGAYPVIQNSRAVYMADSSNLIQTVLHSGFTPVTNSNSRPFGMPPSVLTLSDIVQVPTYIRQALGNSAATVSSQQVTSLRDQQAR